MEWTLIRLLLNKHQLPFQTSLHPVYYPNSNAAMCLCLQCLITFPSEWEIKIWKKHAGGVIRVLEEKILKFIKHMSSQFKQLSELKIV